VKCGAPATRNQRLVGGRPAPAEAPLIHDIVILRGYEEHEPTVRHEMLHDLLEGLGLATVTLVEGHELGPPRSAGPRLGSRCTLTTSHPSPPTTLDCRHLFRA
jgi:hypothetical protein